MNAKRKIFTLLFLASLALSAFPAGAVSFDSQWNAFRNNTAGTTTIVGPTFQGHFCYLSSVQVEETDSGNEFTRCRVRRANTVWILEATLGRSSDADARCSMICYNN